MPRTTNEEIYERVDQLRRELQNDQRVLTDKIDKTYLRIEVFESEVAPLKKFIYGIISVCMLALLTAVLAVVINK